MTKALSGGRRKTREEEEISSQDESSSSSLREQIRSSLKGNVNFELSSSFLSTFPEASSPLAAAAAERAIRYNKILYEFYLRSQLWAILDFWGEEEDIQQED